MAEYVDQLRLDAEQYLKQVYLLSNALDKYNIKVDDAILTGARWNENGEILGATLNATDSKLDKVRATITRLTNAEGELTGQIAVTNTQFTSGAKERTAAVQRVDDAIDKAHREFVRKAAEEQSAMRKTQQIAKEMYNEFERGAASQVAALRQSRLQRAGQLVGNQLISQANISPDATAAEVARVQSAISAISRMVASGQISGKRALNLQDFAPGALASDSAGNRMLNLINRYDTAVLKLGSSHATAALRTEEAQSRIQASITKTGNATVGAEKITEKATRGMFLSWQGFAQLIEVQLIHNLIYRFLNGLTSSIKEAANFQVHLSEIRTISQQNQMTVDSWAGAVRGLSDAYGRGLSDVAEGLYQTLSNQIAHGAESIAFMNSALAFSRVTVATTAESVNLLSAALNSFKLGANDTEKVAAGLFKTIELGRVRAGEMSETYGRVAAMANIMGVNMNELNATIATLTINGIRGSESYTLMNNIMMKLMKPTKEMKDLFAQWGVASGQAAIAAFGFESVLRKVEDAAHGSAAELAEIFRDIRPIRGAAMLTSALDGYADALTKIKNAETDYGAAKKMSFETPGAQFLKELNEIKNIFLVDFGPKMLGSLNGIAASVGGLTNVFNLLSSAIKVAVYAGGAWGLQHYAFKAYTAAAGLFVEKLKMIDVGGSMVAVNMSRAERATSLFTRSLGGIANFVSGNWLMILGTGALMLYDSYSANVAKITSLLANFDTDVEAAGIEATKKLKKEYDTRQQDYEDYLGKMFQGTLQYSSKIMKLDEKLREVETKALDAAAKDIHNIFDLQIKEIEKSIREIEKIASGASENVKRLQDKLEEFQDRGEKDAFQRSIRGLPVAGKVDAQQKRITALSGETLNLFDAKGKDPVKFARDIASGEKKFAEIEALAGKIEDERAKATEGLEKTTERIAELEAKMTGQKDVHAAKDAEDLQRQLKSETNLHKRTLLQQMLTKAIKEAHEHTGDVREGVLDAKEAKELDALKTKKKEIEATLAALPKQATLEQQLLDLAEKRNKVIEESIKLQKSITDAAEIQANKEKAMFEAYKDGVKEMESFRSKDIKDIKDDAGKKKALATFDEIAQKIADSGLMDRDRLDKLVEYRRKIETEADAQIRSANLKAKTEDLAKQKQALIDQQKKIGEDALTGPKLAGEGEKALTETFDLLHSLGRLPGGIMHSSPDEYSAMEAAKNAYKQHQSVETRSAFESQMAKYVEAIIRPFEETSKQFHMSKPEGAEFFGDQFIKFDALRARIPAIIKMFSDAEQANSKTEQSRRANAAEMQRVDAELRKHQDLDQATTNTTKNIQTLGDKVLELVRTLESMDVVIKRKLQDAGQPTSYNYQPAIPGIGTNTAALAQNFNGDVNVTITGIPVSGNVKVDAVALGNEIHRVIRTGMLQPFA